MCFIDRLRNRDDNPAAHFASAHMRAAALSQYVASLCACYQTTFADDLVEAERQEKMDTFNLRCHQHFQVNMQPVANLTSSHVLKSMAAYFIASCKALGIKQATFPSQCNRLRKWVLRYGEAYDVDVTCTAMDEQTGKHMELSPDGYHTLTEEETHAQHFDVLVDEYDNPHIYRPSASELTAYTQRLLNALMPPSSTFEPALPRSSAA